jgi:phage-related minor tail protein/SLT domain-containing protein
MAEERIKGLAIGLDLDTIQLERGLTGLKDKLKTVDSAMKANLSQFDRADKSVEKYESTLQGLNTKLEVHKRAVAAAETEMQNAIKTYGAGSKQAEAATRTYNTQITAVNNLERRIGGLSRALTDLKQEEKEANSLAGKLKSTFEDLGNSVTGIGDKMKGVGTSMTAALTLPLAGAGAGVLGLAKNFSDAGVQMKNAMGLTKKETEALTKSAKDIYEKGYGESLDDVQRGITQTRTNIKGLNGEELQAVTQKAMTLGKTFDADVNEVTRAGGNVMKGFGIDSEKAFDLMGWGAQKGLNFSNEMFDNLSEYAPLYKDMGFSADEYFQLLANGAESGVYNLDYINDAMKEFQIRLKDGSKSTSDAMSGLSGSTQKVWKDFLAGKGTVKDVHNTVLKELKGMDNQVKANEIGVGLYGTKWEDLEKDSMYALGGIDGKLKGVKGTMDEMTKTTEESFGARFKGTLRQAGDAFLPLGNQLLDVAQVVLPKVSGAIKTATNFLEGMSPAAKTATLIFAGIAAAIPPVLAVIGMLVGAFGNIIAALAPVMASITKAGGLLKWLRLGFLGISAPIAATVGILAGLGIAFVALYKKSDTFRSFIDDLVKKIKELGQNFLNSLKPAIEAVKNFFVQQLGVLQKFWKENSSTIIGAAQNIGKVVGAVFTGIGKVIQFVMPFVLAIIKSVWGNIQGVISGALNIIMGLVKIFSGLFTGDFKKMWEGLKQVFKGAVEFIWNFIQLNMFGKLLSLGKIFIGGFKGIFTSMWATLKSLFTKSAGAAKDAVIKAFNLLKSGVTTIFNGVKSFLTTIWNFYKTMITKAAQFILNGVKNSFNNLRSAITTIFNGVKSFLSKLWSALKDSITKAARAIYDGVRKAFTSLKDSTAKIFNSVRDFLSKMWNQTKSNVTNLAGKIKDGVVNAWNSLRDKTTSLFTGIKNKVKGIFDDMVGFAKKLPKRISDGIGSMASKVTGGVKAIGNKMAGQLETVLNAITQKGINVVLDKIGVGKGGKIPELKIPRYEKGTGVGGHKGGLFVAGDGGENELIRFPDGRTIVSPATDTLYYGDKGTQVLNGKQTKDALGVLGDIPHFKKGTNWLEKGADIAKGWASDAWGKGKDMAKSVGNSIGEVWDYMGDPKKLMSKVWKTLNLPTIDAGGILSKIAGKGVSSIKDGSIDFIKRKFDEFMPDFGDVGGGDGSKVGRGSGYGGMHPYVEKYYRMLTSKFKGTHFMGGFNDRNVRGGSHKSMHAYGRAFDIGANSKTMSAMAEFARQHFKDLQYVIYNRRIASGKGGKWRKYNGVNPHTDHVHADFKVKQGGSSGATGKGAEGWRSQIIRAAAQMKVNLSPSELNGIIAQIHRESKGNQTITQSSSLRDINVLKGTPAQGLLQYVPSTFHRYMLKGHTSIKNGYDQLLAFFNNSNWRKDLPYGRRGWGPTGKRRYKNGTKDHVGGDAILGDGGNYEPFLLPNGSLGLSPNISTMFKNLPAGTKVWKDAQTFAKSISSSQNRTELAALVALIGKQIQEAKQQKEKASSTANTQAVKQEINIENKVTIQVAGLLDRETLLKLADQLEEILDDKTRAKLRSEGGFMLG